MKAEKDKIVTLQDFDSSYFGSTIHFEDDDTKHYLAFQSVYGYFKNIANSNHILAWKPKGLPDRITKLPAACNNSHAPTLNCINNKPQLKFDRSCLKQEKVTFTHKQAVDVYIASELKLQPYNISKY